MRLRFWRPEHREAFTDTVATALAAAAAGGTGPSITQARRTAASAWAGLLASADVEGPDAVNARYLANVGARLIRDGCAAHEIRVVAGGVALDPVIVTKRDPWRIQRPRADADAAIRRDALIVHDWADGGLDPWAGTADAATALALQLSLLAESRIVSFRALPADWNLSYQQLVAQGGDPDAALKAVADSLRTATRDAHTRGSPIIVSTGGVPGAPNVDARSSQRSPASYYEMAATRSQPDQFAVELRADLEQTMLAACGLSPAYFTGDVDAVRALRQLWAAPRLKLMAAELSEQLAASVTLQLPAFDRDLQGLARGASALMRGGVDKADALRLMALDA